MKNQAIPLPKPLIDIDVAPNSFDKRTKYASESYDAPKYTQYGGVVEFDIWYTERFGWCIPTLGIRGISRRGRGAGITTARTYAIAIKDGQQGARRARPTRSGNPSCVSARITPCRFDAAAGTHDSRAGECRRHPRPNQHAPS